MRTDTPRVFQLIAALTTILAIAGSAPAATDPLPLLGEQCAQGLEMQCKPAKASFTVGEPVNVWCTITNTTEEVKPVTWHPSAGSHFCLTKDKASWMTGILPLVVPQLRDPLRITSLPGTPEFVLFLPPRSAIQLLMTYKPERPHKFVGIVAYDPATHGGGFFGEEAVEKARNACVFSNRFEYEVTDPEKK